MEASTAPLLSPDAKIHTRDPFVDDKAKMANSSPKERHRRFSSGPVPTGKNLESTNRVAASGPISGLTQRSLRTVAEKAGWKAVGSRLSGHVNGHLPIPQRLPSPTEVSLLENEPLQNNASSTSTKNKKNGYLNSTNPDSPSTACVSCSFPATPNGQSRNPYSNFEKTNSQTSASPSLECKEWPMAAPIPSYKKNLRQPGRTRASSMSWTGGGWDPSRAVSPPKVPSIVELEVPTLLKTCLENRNPNASDNTFVMMIVPDDTESGETNGEPNPSKIALKVSCKFEVCEPSSIPLDQQAGMINTVQANGYHILSTSDARHLEEKTKKDVSVRAIPVSAPISNSKKIAPKSPERIRTTYPFLSRRSSLNNMSSNRLFDSFTSLISSKSKSPVVSASGPIPSSYRMSDKLSKSKDDSFVVSASPSPSVDTPPPAQALIVLTCPQNSNQSATHPSRVSPLKGRTSPVHPLHSADASSNHSQNGNSNNSIKNEHSHENSNSNSNEDASAANHKAYKLPPPPLTDTFRVASTKS